MGNTFRFSNFVVEATSTNIVDSAIEQYVELLQNCINNSRKTGGKFATSSLVNSKLRLESDVLFKQVAQHFRDKGLVVYAPTPLCTWLNACQDAEASQLTMLRGMYQEQTLGNVMLVKIE